MSGNADEIKGKIKQAAGDLTGNDRLRRNGTIDKVAGKVKTFVDKVRGMLTSRR
jgi:uncharacterized protein YjbJ (UPF0337 family)